MRYSLHEKDENVGDGISFTLRRSAADGVEILPFLNPSR